jgi:hypothetical protein
MNRLLRYVCSLPIAIIAAILVYFASTLPTPNLLINCGVACCAFTLVVRYTGGVSWRAALATSTVCALLFAIPSVMEYFRPAIELK